MTATVVARMKTNTVVNESGLMRSITVWNIYTAVESGEAYEFMTAWSGVNRLRFSLVTICNLFGLGGMACKAPRDTVIINLNIAKAPLVILHSLNICASVTAFSICSVCGR